MIYATMLYNRSVQSGMKGGAAVRQIRETLTDFESEIVKDLEQLAVAAGGYFAKELAATDLVSGVQLAADLYFEDDRLLLAEGTEVTHAALMRINQYADLVGVCEPVKVRVPA